MSSATINMINDVFFFFFLLFKAKMYVEIFALKIENAEGCKNERYRLTGDGEEGFCRELLSAKMKRKKSERACSRVKPPRFLP